MIKFCQCSDLLFIRPTKEKKSIGHRTRFKNTVDLMKVENSIFNNYAHSLKEGVHVDLFGASDTFDPFFVPSTETCW